MKVIQHHAVGQELHARKPRDASDEIHKPRTLPVVEKERTMGDTTDPTNKIYCGNLLWQSSLTLPRPRTADVAAIVDGIRLLEGRTGLRAGNTATRGVIARQQVHLH